MKRQGKVYKTLWKYRKPIARTVYKKSRKIWKRTTRMFSKGGKRRLTGDDPLLNESVTGEKASGKRKQ